MIRAFIRWRLSVVEKTMREPLEYLKYILSVSLRGFFAFLKITSYAGYRRKLPEGPFHVVRIVFSRNKGMPVLTCTRADGTTTYSKSRHAFFGPHDLMHFAVETTLNLRQSFFGLVASGWSLTSFDELGSEGDGSRELPAEAALTEFIVAEFQREQTEGVPLTADGFNQSLAACVSGAKPGKRPLPVPRPLSEDDLRRVRELFATLLHRHRALGDGERMELEFPD